MYVTGVIVGSIQNSGSLAEQAQASNVALAAAAGETTWANIVPVALPANTDIRSAVNLVDNPTNMGKTLLVKGSIEAYFGNMGVKNPSEYELEGTSGIESVKAANAKFDGKMYDARIRTKIRRMRIRFTQNDYESKL